ncbi:hypothetical protein F8S13_25965 [Chloroflexia bacterium SDU3-3]|nr:hypothetical protein F8S13_25965 [Chloroflexia bacterium SDU3-3]
MEEVIAFIKDFIEQEYLAFRASALERDEEAYEAQRDIVDSMYGAGLTTEVNRDPEPSEDWFADADRYLGDINPRTLFQIKAYDHPEYGTLYRCYVSSYSKWSPSYSSSLYVARRKSGLRIIARYNIAENRKDWNYRGGQRIEPLGDLIEVRQFQPPSDPVDRAEYEESAKAVKK